MTCVAPRCALTLLCMKPRGHVVSPERKWWVSRYHTTIRFLRNACTSTWIALVVQPERAFTEVFSWFQVVVHFSYNYILFIELYSAHVICAVAMFFVLPILYFMALSYSVYVEELKYMVDNG